MNQLFLIIFLSLAQVSWGGDIWKSSATNTTDSMQVLCGQGQRGFLHGVCVNNNVAATTMTVVNSSFSLTAGTQLTGILSTAGRGCKYYDIAAPKGMLYDKFGTGDVTILYHCY